MSKKRNTHTSLQQHETTKIKKTGQGKRKTNKKGKDEQTHPCHVSFRKQVRSRLACTAVERSDGASLLVGYLNLTE